MSLPLISIIVPILNESVALLSFYEHLSTQEPPWELIFVDASPQTILPEALQNTPKVSILQAPIGRGSQMNLGASKALGDIFLFLHVDLRLPENALHQIRNAITCGYVGGGFFKRFEPTHFLLFWNQFLLNWIRTAMFHSMVGTNGIFCQRAIFQQMKGFQEWPFLEDVDFSDRLKKQGTLKFFQTPIVVSSRKYQKDGVWKRTFKNIYILILFRFLQKNPQFLLKYYSSTTDSRVHS